MHDLKRFFSALIIPALIFLSVNNADAQMFWNKASAFVSADSSHVAVPDSPTLDISGSFTLECWINPDSSVSPYSQMIIQKRTLANIATGYSFLLLGGKISLTINNSFGIIGKTLIPNNTWTHIAGRFNESSGAFSLFINGELDTTAIKPGQLPALNNDSLIIGVGRGIGSPFSGKIDDVRLWNRTLSGSEIFTYFRTSLGVNTGIYNGLVLSLPFQKEETSSPVFSVNDFSGSGNNGYARNITSFNLSEQTSTTVSFNESAEFDGINDYLSAPHHNAISPSLSVTLEAWIFPRSNSNSVIIHKGSQDGSVTNFRLAIQNKILVAGINQNFNFLTNDTLIPNKWSHVGFTYNSAAGKYKFYLNGNKISEGINDVGSISSTADSLYIGGSPGMSDFDGYIDEVRITEAVKSTFEINENLYRSVESSNKNVNDEAAYNLDGLNYSNTGQGPKLSFRNNARFSHPGTIDLQPVSPCLRADSKNFQDAYNIKQTDLRIPFANGDGVINDEFLIYENVAITDINVFVAINHQNLNNVRILLTAPNDQFALLFNQSYTSGSDENLVTIFDDNGDIPNSNKYTSFSPSIKGNVNLNSSFTGTSRGTWKLTIFDDTGADTGRLYGWGIQFNNKTVSGKFLQTSVLIEGLYNESSNSTIRDTVRYRLREFTSPYLAVETEKFYIPVNNYSYPGFSLVQGATPYYIEAVHRNSISVWSSAEVTFNPLSQQAVYEFALSQSSAFGNNMANADNSPVRFGLYSGDVNQDGVIDISDGSLIDNDGLNFASGYIPTDINGDNITDLTDGVFADNNGFNFITIITP
ncbi:MAG: proprotein convertase P-domain-containing protein [Ignavibacteria bacterium]|nr:proprotein convertase P-domain-containing protein [Ignavibacteria bacterium]